MFGEFLIYIGTAFALIFIIEGLIYALFPDAVRKMMAIAIMMPVEKLRMFGAVVAFSGLMIFWFIQAF